MIVDYLVKNMTENITFPEEKIPEIIAIIRLGILWANAIDYTPDKIVKVNQMRKLITKETKEQLEKQCALLEQYWNNQISND